jgi:hypothetical protein
MFHMNYLGLLSFNIFSLGFSLIVPESFFQLSLLVVSILLTAIKCVEMVINIRIRKRELKNLLQESPEKAQTEIPKV